MKNSESENNLMEKIVSLCKRRGFVFQGSEIYGGLAGTYDFGPYAKKIEPARFERYMKEYWKWEIC